MMKSRHTDFKPLFDNWRRDTGDNNAFVFSCSEFKIIATKFPDAIYIIMDTGSLLVQCHHPMSQTLAFIETSIPFDSAQVSMMTITKYPRVETSMPQFVFDHMEPDMTYYVLALKEIALR